MKLFIAYTALASTFLSCATTPDTAPMDDIQLEKLAKIANFENRTKEINQKLQTNLEWLATAKGLDHLSKNKDEFNKIGNAYDANTLLTSYKAEVKKTLQYGTAKNYIEWHESANWAEIAAASQGTKAKAPERGSLKLLKDQEVTDCVAKLADLSDEDENFVKVVQSAQLGFNQAILPEEDWNAQKAMYAKTEAEDRVKIIAQYNEARKNSRESICKNASSRVINKYMEFLGSEAYKKTNTTFASSAIVLYDQINAKLKEEAKKYKREVKYK